MSLFTTPTKVIDLGDGNTVTLRSLTYGEVKHLSAAGGDDDRWLLACILRWDGPGFEGVEPSREAVERLPVQLVTLLTREVAGLIGQETAEKKG